MATSAKTGIGAKLNRWAVTGTTGAWEEVVEVTALAHDGMSAEIIETKKLNDTDRYLNKLKGFLNAGEITATINFTQAGYETLKGDFEQTSPANIFYQIILPDGQGLEWEGPGVSELPLQIGADAPMSMDITFPVDGKPDFVTVATTIEPI